jgi:hypothetical protein
MGWAEDKATSPITMAGGVGLLQAFQDGACHL